ncbi:hypothetical protein SAMN05877809_101387 [Rhodobacter sp. JA431]|uniref:right-handed parallel beta-helix repeat-containing protein n=1 Tax=Rhodobacter sp. JA431 TaxID=570013 RepID=UPI000BD19F80|nr:right-handed parallel beta-helix repeat-containing protein [Rhodobacter sp. JA431]SOB91585.1 hypothetical protein SAMN05877809_101387 [Rhodobacter sp. JA431]
MGREIHISGAGRGAGHSWQDAMPLSALEAALAAIEPDDELLIGFPRDRETPLFWRETEAVLRRSGLASRPIAISFGFIGGEGTLVPANPANGWAQLRRGGSGWPSRTNPDLEGPPFLRLVDASYLTLSGPVAEGAPQNGLLLLEGALDSLTLRDLHLRHAGRVIETTRGTNLTRLCIENCSALGLGRGFARFHSLSNAVLRDLWLDAGFTDGGGTRVLQLISVVAGENLRFENVTLRNAVSAIDAEARGSSYVQGDGIVLEEETRAARFFNCHAVNMGDAGFDLKCDGIEMTDCSMHGCKYGVRIWRNNPNNKLTRVTMTAMRPRARNAAACMWLGGQATLTDCHLIAGAGSAAIRLGKGPDTTERRATLIGGEIDTAGGGSFLAGEPGEVVLRDVLLDGRAITGLASWDGQTVRFS